MRSVVKSAALVEAWFDMLPAAQRPLARELQTAILATAPQLACTESQILCQRDRLEPELRTTIVTIDVHVRGFTRLMTVEI